MEYYRFTQDAAFVAEMQPWVARTLRYMEKLRDRRLTRSTARPRNAPSTDSCPSP